MHLIFHSNFPRDKKKTRQKVGKNNFNAKNLPCLRWPETLIYYIFIITQKSLHSENVKMPINGTTSTKKAIIYRAQEKNWLSHHLGICENAFRFSNTAEVEWKKENKNDNKLYGERY